MIDKERLLAISELKFAGKIENMNDEQMQEYDQKLIAFIENFPEDEEKIKTALHENHYKELSDNLYSMCRTLERIYAEDLARECHKQIGELKDAEHEQAEVYVTDFLSTVAMLSIDIQMAKFLKTAKKTEAVIAVKPETSPDKASDKIILAVDDAAIALNILERNLQDLPYKLICVRSGEDALRYLNHHQPDLFILDIEMPEIDGYELAEKIRDLGQEAPIVFLAGNATRRNVIKAMEAGASDFIVKPINKKHLVSKIQKYL